MPKKRRKKREPELDSKLEAKFFSKWKSAYPDSVPVLQHRFHPTRRFRFDFAWPSKKIALEVQGYGPGHCSLPGMTQDYNKHMEALKHSWQIIYITSIHLLPANINDTFASIAEILSIKEHPLDKYMELRRRANQGNTRQHQRRTP